MIFPYVSFCLLKKMIQESVHNICVLQEPLFLTFLDLGICSCVSYLLSHHFLISGHPTCSHLPVPYGCTAMSHMPQL